MRSEEYKKRTGTCGNGVYWYISGDTLVIGGGDFPESYNYLLPDFSLVEDVDVESVKEALPWGEYLWGDEPVITRTVLEKGVTHIPNHLLSCCPFNEIILPEGLREISSAAFYWCKRLKEIVIPEGIESINAETFCGSGLKRIWLPSSLKYIKIAAFDLCDIDTIYFHGSSEMWNNVVIQSFNDCILNSSVVFNAPSPIPEDRRYLPSGKFRNITWSVSEGILFIEGTGSLWSVNYQDLTPWAPFDNIIRSISVGDGITALGDYVFRCCSHAKTVTLPAAMKSVSHNTFDSMEELEAVMVPENNSYLKTIYGVLFSKDMTKLICYPPARLNDVYAVPDNVKIIQNNAFSEARNLRKVFLPDSLESIGMRSFFRCSLLENIYFGSGLKEIGYHAFDSCLSLEEVTLPPGIDIVKIAVFKNCISLWKIEFTCPGPVRIRTAAFNGCSNLVCVKTGNSYEAETAEVIMWQAAAER